ncbi:MAG: 4'-phosphopantetheinyl transferase superfamily protein [Candidatus Marinimicrobia bacterium]|nr:4'-phosphopantetheinyl transferase superfamily protein [Candidatus Neomarinimicrobiota bacterium]
MGKPYLDNYPDIHFNLSHSGNAIALLFSQKPCGIDIENLKKRHSEEKLVKRFFHKDEVDRYFEATSEKERTNYFFRIWTLKEAYLKAIGTGIRSQLSDLCFYSKENINGLWHLKQIDSSKWIFHSEIIDDAGICMASVQNKEVLKEPKIQIVDYKDINKKMLRFYT